MLAAPGDSETMWFRIREFVDALTMALDFHPKSRAAQFRACNGVATGLVGLVRGVRGQTGSPHYRDIQILVEAVFRTSGRTDLISEDNLKKLVKRHGRELR